MIEKGVMLDDGAIGTIDMSKEIVATGSSCDGIIVLDHVELSADETTEVRAHLVV